MTKEQQFGGVWTQEKLRILQDYLSAYCTALRNRRFTLHYADAFAGTGKHSPKASKGQGSLLPDGDFDGSVRIALKTEPGFHKYHFNDSNPDHVVKIKRIAKGEFSKKAESVNVTNKDANEFVEDFCRLLTRRDRAVLFIDPFSTQMNWKTLNHVAESKKIDLWLLFPLSAVLRMTPIGGSKLEFEEKLNQLLGTTSWQKAFYKEEEMRPPSTDLFGKVGGAPSERIKKSEVEKWVTSRLESIFAHVAEPLELTQRNRPLFLFYFTVSNDSEKAKRLADKIAGDIIRKHGGSP